VQLEVQQLDGPLAFTDYGFVLEDTGDAERPFKVRADLHADQVPSNSSCTDPPVFHYPIQ
jgi:hypothetical protein